ncbi:TcdA/TcdB pore-forming domain-containing protein [Providencia huaxiensis]|uniref:TcdA/TcdB pore-forming domain-containing protein n=1 Tax=Providencia huaxiensis TaxID=2027290 RepID=UPI00143D2D93|nr:TcdA/TcdB pore-forming domain-containing protein [Providencia huaxiensis]
MNNDKTKSLKTITENNITRSNEIANLTKMSKKSTIDTSELINSSGIAEKGKVEFIKTKDDRYVVRYLKDDNKSKFSINSYFLSYNKTDQSHFYPYYIDIPKEPSDSFFLFTDTLDKHSLIVTDYDKDHYRVYNDCRINSSILYDNVVMAVDYKDYRIKGKDSGNATAYMQYVNNEWQLFYQKQETKYYEGKKNLILNGNGRLVQNSPSKEINNKNEFIKYRDAVHQDILSLANELNIEVKKIDSGLYIQDKDFPESSINNTWRDLNTIIYKKLNRNISILDEVQNSWRNKIKQLYKISASESIKIKVLQQKIIQSDIYINLYQNRYSKALVEARQVERSWLWWQLKEKYGMSAAVKAGEQIIQGGSDENKKTVNERYENLVFVHKNSNNMPFRRRFSEGMEDFNEVNISGVNRKMSSLELKKLYLTLELSPIERGALYQRISKVSHEEYINYILSEAGKVSKLFYSFNSQSNRLIPQDFYLSLMGGETKGRCYPLVRAMSVALAKDGENGADVLINKLFIASASPKDKDSILLKSALEKLHSNIDAVEASFSHGRMGIEETQKLLDAGEKTVMFAINSQNHSMLIGKTVGNDQSHYYFYDPNFGLFTFNNSRELFIAFKMYMVEHKMADFYSAFGSAKKPHFEIITISTEDMAIVSVGNGLKVGNLSDSNELSQLTKREQESRRVIEKQNIIKNDLQLQGTLSILEAEQWGDRLDNSIKGLLFEYQMTKKWVPIFSTLQETKNGKYRLQFVNYDDPEKSHWVETEDTTFLEFNHYYNKKMEEFKEYSHVEERDTKLKEFDNDIHSFDGLNTGVAVQSLIQWYSDENNNIKPMETDDFNLALALKIHGYINYGMISHGIMSDLSKIVGVVRKGLKNNLIVESKAINIFSSSLARTANESTAILFNGALVGIDVYELSRAKSEPYKIIFGTQLAFDSANLITGGASLGAGLLGASGVSTFMSGAGVICAGLSIGFTSLARNFVVIGEDAKSVGHYFYMLDQAYQSNGYDYLTKRKIATPKFGAVFKKIDLKNNQIEFDSQYIYRTTPHSAGGGRKNYIFWAGNFPTMLHDRQQALNIRQGIGYTNSYRAYDYLEAEIIVLPVTPKSYIKYNYNLWPGATTRHDNGFDIIRRLENTDKFDYDFYIFPSENTITQIFHEYVDTSIEVNLDDKYRYVVVPKIPNEWYGKLNYSIKGNGGVYRIAPQLGTKITLFDESGSISPSNWLIDGTFFENDEIIIHHDKVIISGVEVYFSSSMPKDNILYINSQNEIYKIDCLNLTYYLISEDGNKWIGKSDRLSEHLDELNSQHKFNSQYIIIENYQYNGRNVGRAFYQTSTGHYIFTHYSDDKTNSADSFVILGDSFYFYSKKYNLIWVTGSDNKIKCKYMLVNNQGKSFELINIWENNGAVYFSCRYQAHDLPEVVTYMIDGDSIIFIGVFVDELTHYQLSEGQDKIPKKMLEQVLDKYILSVSDHEKLVTDNNANSSNFAEIILITGVDKNNNVYHYWLKYEDGTVIKSNVISYLDSIDKKNVNSNKLNQPKDIILVASLIDEEGNDVFYFYSRDKSRIYRQVGASPNISQIVEQQVKCIEVSNVDSIVFSHGILLVINKDGIVSQVSAKGEMKNFAINENWFDKKTIWWESLKEVNNKNGLYLLLGIKKLHNNEVIPAWYDNGNIIIAHQLSSKNTLQYLGVDEKSSAAIIYDMSSKRLYWQPLATTQELDKAFTGNKMYNPASLPSLYEIYPNMRFETVKRLASGLIMYTSNNEILYHDSSMAHAEGSKKEFLSSLLIKGGNQKDIINPPVIDNVKNIVLSAGNEQDSYIISRAAWLHYQVIIINNHASDYLTDTLVLPVDDMETLVVSRFDDDLILTDINTNSMLLINKAFEPNAEKYQHLQLRFLNSTEEIKVKTIVESYGLTDGFLSETSKLDKSSEEIALRNENQLLQLADTAVSLNTDESTFSNQRIVQSPLTNPPLHIGHIL